MKGFTGSTEHKPCAWSVPILRVRFKVFPDDINELAVGHGLGHTVLGQDVPNAYDIAQAKALRYWIALLIAPLTQLVACQRYRRFSEEREQQRQPVWLCALLVTPQRGRSGRRDRAHRARQQEGPTQGL